MMVVPVDTVWLPAEAGTSTVAWAAVMTMDQENYAAALHVKCCAAKDRGTQSTAIVGHTVAIVTIQAQQGLAYPTCSPTGRRLRWPST